MTQLQLLASSAGDGTGNLAGAEGGNLVRQRGRGESSLGNRVLGTTEVNVLSNRVAGLLGVGEEDGLGGAAVEGGALDEDLSTHARVDTSEQELVVVGVDDVDGAEADERSTGVDVGPMVVGVGDVKLALVLAAVAVGVTNQGSLPLLALLLVGNLLRTKKQKSRPGQDLRGRGSRR